MPSNKSGSKRILVPEARHALEQMKLEIASELGMSNYDSMDKGSLTSRENGYVGGNITRNLVQMAQENLGKSGGAGSVGEVVKPHGAGGTSRLN